MDVVCLVACLALPRLDPCKGAKLLPRRCHRHAVAMATQSHVLELMSCQRVHGTKALPLRYRASERSMILALFKFGSVLRIRRNGTSSKK